MAGTMSHRSRALWMWWWPLPWGRLPASRQRRRP